MTLRGVRKRMHVRTKKLLLVDKNNRYRYNIDDIISYFSSVIWYYTILQYYTSIIFKLQNKHILTN